MSRRSQIFQVHDSLTQQQSFDHKDISTETLDSRIPSVSEGYHHHSLSMRRRTRIQPTGFTVPAENRYTELLEQIERIPDPSPKNHIIMQRHSAPTTCVQRPLPPTPPPTHAHTAASDPDPPQQPGFNVNGRTTAASLRDETEGITSIECALANARETINAWYTACSQYEDVPSWEYKSELECSLESIQVAVESIISGKRNSENELSSDSPAISSPRAFVNQELPMKLNSGNGTRPTSLQAAGVSKAGIIQATPLPCVPSAGSTTSLSSCSKSKTQRRSIHGRQGLMEPAVFTRADAACRNNEQQSPEQSIETADVENGDEFSNSTADLKKYSYANGSDEPCAPAPRPISVAQANRHSAIIGDQLYSLQAFPSIHTGFPGLEEDTLPEEAEAAPLTPEAENKKPMEFDLFSTHHEDESGCEIATDDESSRNSRIGRSFNNPLGGGYIRRTIVENKPIVGRSSVAAYRVPDN